MDAVINDLVDILAERLSADLSSSPHDGRILVGICGVPASGKTSLAINVTERLNRRIKSSQDVAILVSQDGWHLPRSALDEFDDPKSAHDRRGAAFTFDGVAFSAFVASLRLSNAVEIDVVDDTEESPPGITETDSISGHRVVYAPGFSHTLKDPTPNAVAILPHHRVVIIEGLYTFLGVEPWRAAAETLDERWFVDVDSAVAKERLVKRHVVTGVAKDMEEAEWRASNNDIPNGDFIRANMLQPTRVIRSIDDPLIAQHGRTE